MICSIAADSPAVLPYCLLRLILLSWHQKYMVPPLLWPPEGMTKQWNSTSTSCHSRRSDARAWGIQDQIQYHRHRHWKPWNLASQCSYLQACEFGPSTDQQSPSQWCSAREQSCWQHLPYRRSTAQDGKVDDRYSPLTKLQCFCGLAVLIFAVANIKISITSIFQRLPNLFGCCGTLKTCRFQI